MVEHTHLADRAERRRHPSARACGVERAQFERNGRKKSDFDPMIACTAIEHEATLVTRDIALKDSAIGGLVVQDLVDFPL